MNSDPLECLFPLNCDLPVCERLFFISKMLVVYSSTFSLQLKLFIFLETAIWIIAILFLENLFEL